MDIVTRGIFRIGQQSSQVAACIGKRSMSFNRLERTKESKIASNRHNKRHVLLHSGSVLFFGGFFYRTAFLAQKRRFVVWRFRNVNKGLTFALRRLLWGDIVGFGSFPENIIYCGRQVRAAGLFGGSKTVSCPIKITVTFADYF